MMSDTSISNAKWHLTTAWLMLLAVWLVTPFIGDRVPVWTIWLYGIFTIAAGVFGLYIAWKRRSIVLAITATLTFFAWLIVLVVALALFGV